MEITSQKCCIPFCMKAQEDPSIILHEFPTNPDIAAKWIRNINLFLKNGGTWFPQCNSVLCSAHFLPSDFVPTSKKKVLKRKSAPSLFECREARSNKIKFPPKKSANRSPMIEVLKPKTDNLSTSYQISSSVDNDNRTIQVSKVMSLSDNSAENNSNLMPPQSFVTLPTANSEITPNNFKTTPALFNGQQLILLPQLPQASLAGNTGFIIIPEGNPVPNLGKDTVLVPGGKGPIQSGGNMLLLQQPNLPSVINSDNTNLYKNISMKKEQIIDDIKKRESINNNYKEYNEIPDFVDDESENNETVHDSNNSVSPQKQVINEASSFSENFKNKSETFVCVSSDANKKRHLNEHDKSQEKPAKKKKTTPPAKKRPLDLIEIAPSTFMKINPDIIRVAKKETPNGNTVLQFIMNPNLMALNNNQPFFSLANDKSPSINNSIQNNTEQSKLDAAADPFRENSNGVDHHIPDSTSQNDGAMNVNDDTSGPVLASTHLSGTHSFVTARMKYNKSLKLKSTQICRLTSKVKELEQKLEELENKCIVQERQLNFASLKKLKSIKKDADQGEPHAAFILEQIRGYANKNRVVWSDTTLIQCSIWCRKAPYAYEYFKKADLFRLPAMTTIKRFMSRNPEIKMQIKNKVFKKSNCDDSSSSSDFDSEFDFDETDNENGDPKNEISVACENIQTISPEMMEDSQSSVPLNLEPHVVLNALSESSQSTSEHPQLLDSEASPNKMNVKLYDHRQPLTNIFGKILCRNPKNLTQSINEEITPAGRNGEEILNSNQQMSIDTRSSGQVIISDVAVSNGQNIILADAGPDNQQIVDINPNITNSCDNDLTNQQLVNKDESSQQIHNEDSNSQELVVHQTVLNAQESDIVNEDSNSYYLQTTEEDGITTINLDGQEIVIPPGTILKLNSDLIGSDELGNHFLIIPSEESGALENQQYIISDTVIEEPTNIEKNTDDSSVPSNVDNNSNGVNDTVSEVVAK